MKTLLALFLIFPFFSYANEDAMQHALRAFSELKQVKSTTKRFEKKAIRLLEENSVLDKESAGLVAAISSIAISGEIDTTQIKGLKTEIKGFEVSPQINYNIYQNTAEGLVMTTYDF